MVNYNLRALELSVPQYLLAAVLAGIIAGVTVYLGHPVFAGYIIVGAIIAALTAALTQYASTGNIPGTSIPIHTLYGFGIGAALVVLEYLSGYTTYTTQTIIAGLLIGVVYLFHEVVPTPTPVSASA